MNSVFSCFEEAIAAIFRCFGVESQSSAAENPIGEPLLQQPQPTDDDDAPPSSPSTTDPPPPDDRVDPLPLTTTLVSPATTYFPSLYIFIPFQTLLTYNLNFLYLTH